MEAVFTEFKGVKRYYKAVAPTGKPEETLTNPTTEKLLLRLNEVVAKNCSDDDIIEFIRSNYLIPNGVEDSEWKILEHKAQCEDGKFRMVKAIYPSSRYVMAHMVALEIETKFYNMVSEPRRKEAERLGGH